MRQGWALPRTLVRVVPYRPTCLPIGRCVVQISSHHHVTVSASLFLSVVHPNLVTTSYRNGRVYVVGEFAMDEPMQELAQVGHELGGAANGRSSDGMVDEANSEPL